MSFLSFCDLLLSSHSNNVLYLSISCSVFLLEAKTNDLVAEVFDCDITSESNGQVKFSPLTVACFQNNLCMRINILPI